MVNFTKISSSSGPNILQYPEYTAIAIDLDYSAIPGGCIKAGTPISNDGRPVNDATAVGIIKHNVNCGEYKNGLVIVSGCVRLDVIEANTGLTISEEAKSAMPNITFFGKQGLIKPSDGGSGGPSSMIILDVYENYSDTEGDLSTYALNISFADLSRKLTEKTTAPAFAVVHDKYGQYANTYPIREIQLIDYDKIALVYPPGLNIDDVYIVLSSDGTFSTPEAG